MLHFSSANNAVVVKMVAALSVPALLSAMFVLIFGTRNFFPDAYGVKNTDTEILETLETLETLAVGIFA